jgi:hypothetical protein
LLQVLNSGKTEHVAVFIFWIFWMRGRVVFAIHCFKISGKFAVAVHWACRDTAQKSLERFFCPTGLSAQREKVNELLWRDSVEQPWL